MDAYSNEQSLFGDKEASVGFSVVMPSLNQAGFISDALNSILGQNYEDLEIIVMDGGSTDGTVEILESYGDALRWVSEKDNGQSHALAKGFNMATKEWLTWLNSDDIQTNNALYQVQEAIRRNPGAQVVVGQGHYVDESGAYLRPYPTINVGPGADVCRELFMKGYLAQPSVFFHRDAYRAVDGINAGMQFTMDYDLWVRLARNGFHFVGIPDDISGNRWYESTKTASQPLPLLAEAVAVQTREFGRVSPYFIQAVSDYLYSVLHSPHRGDKYHFVYRMIYFKCMWICLNWRRPLHCIWGLISENIAKSGPIIGDKITLREAARYIADAVWQKRGKSRY